MCEADLVIDPNRNNKMKMIDRLKRCKGVTLTELMMTLVLASIMMLALGMVLVDNQKGWLAMYSRTFSDVVVHAYVTQNRFFTIVRKSSIAVYDYELSADETKIIAVEVYHYSDNVTTDIDRYARFYIAGGTLSVDEGVIDTTVLPWVKETPTTAVLAQNVASGYFDINGSSIQLVLNLDNGKENMKVITSAIRHNDWF
jgi:prepilin-type N-terminal cleavage/methylation domain-containing protein